MTKIEVVQNDQLYNLNFALQDADGVVLNLSNIGSQTTLKFKAQKIDTGVVTANAAMTILDATAGTCFYQVASGVFNEKGSYKAEIEVTYGNGKIITITNMIVSVKADLPVT